MGESLLVLRKLVRVILLVVGNSYYNILNQGEMTINSGVEVSQTGHFSSLIDNGWYNGSENTAKINAKLTINAEPSVAG